MADGGGHFAKRRQLGTLRQGLLGHGQIFLNLFALCNLALKPQVKLPQFRRFALKQCHAQRRLAAKHIEGQCKQNGKAHDFQRQNAVHSFAHGSIGRKAGHAPSAKTDPVFGAHHCFAQNIRVGGIASPAIRDLDRPLDGTLCRLLCKGFGFRQSPPARLCRQNDRALAVSDQHRVRDPRPSAFELGQIDLYQDHADRIAAAFNPARIGEDIATAFARQRGEHGLVGPHPLDEIAGRAMIGPQSVPVGCGHRAPVTIQQHQGRRTNFIDKRNQPLRRLRKIV
ncbi:tyrosinase family protein [Primorskyibacter marinus]|uniref:tyrosinase family protein n=1 Tax=Primorskyibacter marinus TaxID=1977320 RepID=UPI003F69E161